MGFPQRTCGGVRLVVVTEEQRYGPRWLRDNDDKRHRGSLLDTTFCCSHQSSLPTVYR